jgi:hypothetical protein
MGKRSRRRRSRPRVETVDYEDAEGGILTLRCTLSAPTIVKIEEGLKGEAATPEDAWRRRTEMLFERLAVGWEIAELPLTDQAMLLGRYRMAGEETQRWVRETITEHLKRHIPELSDP